MILLLHFDLIQAASGKFLIFILVSVLLSLAVIPLLGLDESTVSEEALMST